MYSPMRSSSRGKSSGFGATAYNILRHNGIEVGKRDFLGTIVL